MNTEDLLLVALAGVVVFLLVQRQSAQPAQTQPVYYGTPQPVGYWRPMSTGIACPPGQYPVGILGSSVGATCQPQGTVS